MKIIIVKTCNTEILGVIHINVIRREKVCLLNEEYLGNCHNYSGAYACSIGTCTCKIQSS